MYVTGSDWEGAAAAFLDRADLTVADIGYGPFAPMESELNLLGDLHGLRVLDIGCGSGHTTVAFALRGATATGLDASEQMLRHARRLAQAHGVDADFVQGDAEVLGELPGGTFDLVFSSYALHYVARLDRCLAACRRVLTGGGRLVIAVEHPLRACFFDDENEELASFPVRAYASAEPMHWTFPESDARMTTYARKVSDWTGTLAATGFRLCRLVEPDAPVEVMDELWPEDGVLAPLRNIPHTLILLAERERDGLATETDRKN